MKPTNRNQRLKFNNYALLATMGFLYLVLSADAKAGDKTAKFHIHQRHLAKHTDFSNRKIGRMDNGRMVMYYDNSGLIGDRDFLRTIEWPASTNNYMVWQVGILFGAVTTSGDTIVSETYTDISDNQFNPEPGFDNPNYISSIFDTTIVARSDIIESYAPSWNGLWPNLEGGFIHPDLLRRSGRQESFWVMRDNNDPANSPAPPLNLEVVSRLVAINSQEARDMIFAIYKIKNIGVENLNRCRFGVLVDPDMPALVGADFDDDDVELIRELKLVYTRDHDNSYASRPGFDIGYFGTMLLLSPKVAGQELGLTAWRTFSYDDMPDSGKANLSIIGPDPAFGIFASRDHAQYGYMEPDLFMRPRFNRDVVFMMSSGDFALPAGASVKTAVAFIGASDSLRLIEKTYEAQFIFDNDLNVSVGQNRQPLPKKFMLLQNYPNPFNATTAIRYTIATPGYVTLKVFDLTGREVANLVSQKKPAGEYKVQWNPANLPSGVYFYRLQMIDSAVGSGHNFVEAKKLVLMK